MKKSVIQRVGAPALILAIGLAVCMDVQAAKTCDQYSSATIREKARGFQAVIDAASSQYGVSSDLIKAVITAETCFRPYAVSPKGASGLMQLMPATARRFGAPEEPTITQNIHAGTRYLGWLLNRYQGSVPHAVAAYNSGEGTVDKHGLDVPYQETQRYLSQVMNAYRKLSNRASGGAVVIMGQANRRAERVQTSSVVERTLTKGVVERRLVPKSAEKRLLPSCMTASRSLHRATYHSDSKGERTFFYKVKKNDSLDKIMRLTGSSAVMIKRYNDLHRSLIKPGQTLKVSECRLRK